MRPYIKGEDLTEVSISEQDKANKSPKKGDMIARNPKNHKDEWLVAKQYFNDNLEEILIAGPIVDPKSKTLHNTDTSAASKNVKDIVFWGNGDTFKLISKASSKNEGWMKSTKAMEIVNFGCVIQVTTQQGDNIAEAVTFVPRARIEEKIIDHKVVSRKIVAI